MEDDKGGSCIIYEENGKVIIFLSGNNLKNFLAKERLEQKQTLIIYKHSYVAVYR
jgi:hypothetical protein